MTNKRTAVEVKTTGPSYLAWRGELLAELALARLPSLLVHKRADHPASDLPYDFLVATERGLCFFVEVKAFSSSRLAVSDVRTVPELLWSVDAGLIRRVRANQSPFILFLFDADTDHGRYLRLDTLPDPQPGSRRLVVQFPLEQTINRRNVERLIADLDKAATA